jgi:protein TonB
MHATISDFSHSQAPRKKGLVFVALAHLVLGWGLWVGTTHHHKTALKKSLEMLVIEDVALLPPPPAPKTPKTPPPSLPMPEVVAERTAPTIELAVAPTVVPKLEAIAPAPVAQPSPVVAVVPAKMEAALICPGQVRPEIPRKALIDNIQGLVKAQAVVEGGHVKEVNILSGPRIFHDAVRTAMLQYQCATRSTTVVAMQEFNFRFE